ncbi:MAG: GNAT family N-acetyltransferase [Bacteriovoracaceae bacterium]|nr:GNAT family N-acetyltransferase [Bacteriovoracaceae bacterium]
MTSQFSIRKLHSDDWALLKELRLESLRLHPNFFYPSKDETKFTEEEWRGRVSNAYSASFGLFDSSQMIGLTAVVREGADPQSSRAHFVSSYLREAYRRRGLSKLFFEARLQWAREQKNIRTIILEHRDDNEASKRAQAKYNFKLISALDFTWPDGQVRPSLLYEMEI